jgi:hypothetical protein
MVAPFGRVHVICSVVWYSGRTRLIAQHGYWYRIQDPHWHGTFYAPADSFLNGDPPGGPYRGGRDGGYGMDEVPTCTD